MFGAWINEMGSIRSIGIERARANLGLRNLAYNLKRFVYLETRGGVGRRLIVVKTINLVRNPKNNGD